jgi:hypothetical protein
MNHFLKGVVEENSVTPHYLLRRMHEVDPDLRYSPLDYKMELSSMSGRQERSHVAAQLLERHQADPTFLRVRLLD